VTSTPIDPDFFHVHPDVQKAIDSGKAVVALESTIISHGLPRPENIRVANEVEDTVRSRGAIPATIAVLNGVAHIGLTSDQITEIATRDDVSKASIRDLGIVSARRGYAATTVAATSHLAHLAGIEVFATGGLGGVHRQARDSWDESADLTALGSIPMTVVCSGVKSILDVGATLERLETLSIGVVGYGSEQFPGFYLTDSGFTLDWYLSDPSDIAAVIKARRKLNVSTGLIVANPLPNDQQLDPDLHDRVLTEGLALAQSRNITGKAVTPFLLDFFHRTTHGQSLVVNANIIVRNSELAARIAVATKTSPETDTD
jgi:pseudouridine-5'-phosphate glycosidase